MGIKSRLQHVKNGIAEGSVQTPLLFNTSDLPTTVTREYAYADDLAIMDADGDWQAVEGVLTKVMDADEDWQAVEGVLTKVMATISEYLQTGKLKLSTTKMVSAAVHLNKEAKRELKSQIQYRNPVLLLRA